jgi:alpha-amylase
VLASNDAKLTDDWRRLQTSDHFYYMCTKWFADGDVHAYFSPYASPYEAFATYMSALKDLEIRVRGATPS